MIWNEEFETLPREALEALQLKRLRGLVDRVCATVPFYRKKLEEQGYRQGDIRSLADLSRLPFTTKTDLRDNYPFGLFAVPMERVVRIHASSGTTGKPVVVGYTKRDIDTWAELMARTLSCGGTTKGDVVHNAYGYGLFTGGLGAHYGAEKIGAAVIPMSGGNSKRQIMLMQDFGSTILLSTPSYALNLAEMMAEEGVDPASLKLTCGLFGAEPWSEAMRKEIEKKLRDQRSRYLRALRGDRARCGVGVPGREARPARVRGPFPSRDHRPRDGIGRFRTARPANSSSPRLRRRRSPSSATGRGTSPASSLAPCSCGRTHVRMERISGRTDDMLIIRGVNVFPSQIESVLFAVGGLEPHYQLIVTREGTLDVLEVQVEVNESIFSDEVKGLEGLARRVEHDIKDLLGISCKVKLVEPKTIQRSEGKAKRVIDQRKN